MRTDLPQGTVTLLFTDVESSTRLLRDLGADAYGEALAEHRRVIRAACRPRGGVEVDTQGDAIFVAFGGATDAILAAQAITQALERGPLRVRIGVHTGTPLLTDEGYVGEDVHLAARVAASGHGGQVVLTGSTRTRLHEPPPLLDLGEHRLADFSDPVALYQLGGARFPPLRTISASNLPLPASAFIGRRHELADVSGLIHGGARLVTLTGPGGTGKSRLALEAAAALRPEYGAGAFWVALSAIRDPALVIETIAQALGAKAALRDHIGEREMLVLLDNFEQVIQVAPELPSLLSSCPGLTLLVTSRELLRVHGEVEYAVPPLDAGEAVALFAARSHLAATGEVAELCARLDHLPLAVELAAARARGLSPRQMIDRLARRLDLLAGGRDADPRQATLRATIDWSHDLLSTRERELFRHLAVFAGGATLEAAEGIVDADLDSLQSLVQKSLIRMSNERFRMLETVRDYATERLDESAEAVEIRARHARWFATVVESAEPELEGSDQDLWFERLADEHDNIRAALGWAMSQGDPNLALQIAGSTATFWWVQGHWGEGRRWLDAALSHEGQQDPALRAKALEGLAHLAVRQWDVDRARAPGEESLAIRRGSDDAKGIARSLRVVSLIADVEGDLERFHAITEQSAAYARLADDPWALSMALNNLGYMALETGEFELATAHLEEALGLARRRGDHRSESFFLENLAIARLELRAVGPARDAFAESLRIAHRLGFIEVEATDLIGLAAIAAADGDSERAALLLGGAEQLIAQTGGGLDPVEAALRARTVAAIEREMGSGRLAAGVLEGRSAPRERVFDLALELLPPPTHEVDPHQGAP